PPPTSTRSQPKWLDPLNLTIPYPRDPLPELKPPIFLPVNPPESSHLTKRRQVSSATGPTRSQKRKRTELDTAENSLEPNSNLDSESDPDVAVMDITQDSNCDNTKMKPGAKKTRGPAVTEFDDVELYFESPVTAKGDKLFYKCKWCSKPYKKGASGRSNLRVHRDGGGWDDPLALVGVPQLKQVVQICQGRGR
ncbi:hypothetical protein MJO28_007633, partial [Puccinia striiformis f. sp. tritici]